MATVSNTSLHPLGEQDHGHYHQQQHQPIRRSSGRKKTKSGNEQKKNKAPQRGMGVEKLERLRFAERFKKISEINTTNPMNPYFNNASGHLVNVSGPCQFSKFGGGFEGPNAGFGQMGLNHNGYLGDFHGLDLFGSSVVGSSKNTSSPVITNCCNKKKRFNGGENFGGCRVLKPDMYSVEECGFLGLNIGDNNHSKRENQGFQMKPPLMHHQVGYAVRPGHPGVEVLAVHKKGSRTSSEDYHREEEEGSCVVMEYEFFPCGRNSDPPHNDDELLMMKMMMMIGNYPDEASAAAAASQASSSSIDLSLKL